MDSEAPLRICYDFNNVAIATLHLPKVEAKSTDPDWDFWYYIMFKRMSSFIVDALLHTRAKYVEVYLAGDLSGVSWRKELYAPYKADRKPSSDIDWPEVWERLDKFKQLLAQYIPWNQITVPATEADDIIYTLIKQAEQNQQRCMIYSTDADYLQLCSDLTEVYRPSSDAFVAFPTTLKIAGAKVDCSNVEEFLNLSVLTGQGGKDNVYNIKTPTDWEPTPAKKRKPPFGVVAARKALAAPEGMQTYLTKLGCYDNYQRNKTLIDMEEIPESVRDAVLEAQEALPSLNNAYQEFTHMMSWPSLMEDAEFYDETYKEIFTNERVYNANTEECTQQN